MERAAWQCEAFTMPGLSAEDRKSICQDATAVTQLSEGRCLLVVSDGVGSQPFSDRGARHAVDLTTSILSDRLNEGTRDLARSLDIALELIISEWREWAMQIASTLGTDIRGVDCTLAITILDGDYIHTRSIGDSLGVIIARDQTVGDLYLAPSRDHEGRVRTLASSSPSTASGAVSLTAFDPSAHAVALATDGIERALFLNWSGAENYIEIQPRFVDGLRQWAAGSLPLEALRLDIERGLVTAYGAKGDDIGVALARR